MAFLPVDMCLHKQHGLASIIHIYWETVRASVQYTCLSTNSMAFQYRHLSTNIVAFLPVYMFINGLNGRPSGIHIYQQTYWPFFQYRRLSTNRVTSVHVSPQTNSFEKSAASSLELVSVIIYWLVCQWGYVFKNILDWQIFHLPNVLAFCPHHHCKKATHVVFVGLSCYHSVFLPSCCQYIVGGDLIA